MSDQRECYAIAFKVSQLASPLTSSIFRFRPISLLPNSQSKFDLLHIFFFLISIFSVGLP